VFTEPLFRNGLHNPVVPPLLGAKDIENSLIYCCVLDRVYRAVAWQRGGYICYIINRCSASILWRIAVRNTLCDFLVHEQNKRAGTQKKKIAFSFLTTLKVRIPI
jgi:hypothetical protein